MTSDSGGKFQFAQVPPGGGYTVSVVAPGFRNSKVSGLGVELGKASMVDVKLEVGQISESVVVAADAVMVDTQSSSAAVTIDRSFFDVLPKGRSFYDLIAIAPGARNEAKTNGFAVDGASGAENVFYLGGMNVTDIQTGVMTNQFRIPSEMVQQVEVKNGVMEAQYGGAMGGVVNGAIRSGSNAFHGQVGFYYNNDSMEARDRPTLRLDPANEDAAQYFQNAKDDFRTWNPIFSLGGPLLRNKVFFYTAYEPNLKRLTRAVDFTTGEKGTYNRTENQQYFSNKVDFAATDKLRMDMTWLWNPVRNTGVLPAKGGTDAYENPWALLGDRTSGTMLSGTMSYAATSRLVVSFRGGWQYTNYHTNYGIPNTTAVYYSNSNVDVPGIPSDLQGQMGWISQATELTKFDKYDRKNYNADVSYIANWHGQHSLKGGWQMNQLSDDTLKSTYPNGYYRYYWSTPDNPAVYKCQTSQCVSGTGAYGYYRYRVLGTIGKASSDNNALFIQDNWHINKRLSLNLGIRTEREFVPGFSTDGSSAPAITFSWGKKFSPRAGVAFDPKGDGKQKIYASFGWFYDLAKYDQPRGSFGGDVWREYFYALDDPNLVKTNQGLPADPTKLPGKFLEVVDWRIPSNDPSQHKIDPDLKPMKQQMFDIGYDYSISPTLVASARYTNRRLIRTVEDTGYMSPNGEAYLIANPGEGFTTDAAKWATLWAPGVPTPPKPVRKYDAAEFRLDKRFSSRYQFAASYTFSKLRGNYAGLASSDEPDADGVGRSSPSGDRNFDEPWVYVKENGQYAYGDLATDRPHSFKLFGSYALRSKVGTTMFSPIVSWYSGTPLTSMAALITSTPAMPYGRGNLGRTPMFFNSDFSVTHEFAPFKSREDMKVKFQFTAFNLFNSATMTNVYTDMIHENDGQIQFKLQDGSDDYAAPFRGFNVKQLAAEQNVRIDPRYGMDRNFQSPRSLRLHLSFSF